MGNTSLIRTALLLALLAAFGLAATGYAPAADRAPAPGRNAAPERTPPVVVVGSEASLQFLPLGVGKSVVIDLPRDIKDVLVGDPQYANAVIRSSRRAYIIGVKTGQTSVYFFDAEGQQIAGFDIAITRDLNGLRAAIKQVASSEWGHPLFAIRYSPLAIRCLGQLPCARTGGLPACCTGSFQPFCCASICFK